MKITIYRYDPEQNVRPYMQTYSVDPTHCQGVMLLDALELIKATTDPTLAFRRSCGGGVCGSDGMNINGKNGLACVTPLSSLPEEVTIRPLPGQPVIRDLIVDLRQFYKQYDSINPYLRGVKTAKGARETLQSPAQRAELDGLYECILCACCSTACPSWWWNPDKFAGPAALLWACRFIKDSRDITKDERLKLFEDLYRLYRCRSIMNCVDVCPKGLNPTHAIGQIRDELAFRQRDATDAYPE